MPTLLSLLSLQERLNILSPASLGAIGQAKNQHHAKPKSTSSGQPPTKSATSIIEAQGTGDQGHK